MLTVDRICERTSRRRQMDEGAACRGMQRRPGHAECNVTVGSARITWYRSHVAAAVAVESATSRSSSALPPSVCPRSSSVFYFSLHRALLSRILQDCSPDTYSGSLSSIMPPLPPSFFLFPHLWENVLEIADFLRLFENFFLNFYSEMQVENVL